MSFDSVPASYQVHNAPPPPYTPSYPTNRNHKPNLAQLPLPILFRIISLTLDHRATPSQWWSDPEEERVRRVWGLFKGLRGVCRSFWLVSTSILRSMYHPNYLELVQKGYSSDAYPHDSHPSSFGNITFPSSDTKASSSGQEEDSGGSIFEKRSRETAILDRFIAIRVGEELRRVESSFSEESGNEKEIFFRFQPAARLEDLLLTLPPELISPLPSPRPPSTSLPLPQPHLSVILTPTWCQLYIWSKPFGQKGNGRDLVIEVKKLQTLEGTLRMIKDGLDDLRRGRVPWGGRCSG